MDFLMHSAPDRHRRQQRGVTLLELMVGIAIGLIVVAVAMVALMTSRGITGTVSDATLLQQQASYAFRIIGQQIRQAGSLELSLAPSMVPASGVDAAMSPVAFDPPDPTGARAQFDRASSTVTVTSASSPNFTVGFQNYAETVAPTPPASLPTSGILLRDCLGQNPVASGSTTPTYAVLTSKFERKASTNELVCTGRGSTGAQAIIGNVTDFQTRYVQQVPNTATLKYISDASTITQWSSIYAIEVCLELTGSEETPTPAATYINCSGTETSYGNRLKMVFRNVYQIRSQGQV